MNNNTHALEISQATVVYPDGESTVTALDKADLSAKPGELTAIIGESGSGKSTLLSVAAGLVTPTSGRVEVAGIDLTGADDKTRSKVRRENIGVIFQQANLLASLTVREQLLIMDHIRGVRMRPQRADELLEQVGLANLGSRRMAQLSGGQRQRVNIARALMAEPALLLADEPTGNLDSATSQDVLSLLKVTSDHFGQTVVMITHNEEIAQMADRIVRIEDGKITKGGEADA